MLNRERILVAGIGNIFLGDDAFGVEVAQRLAARPLPDSVAVIDFGIRSLDLAFALLDPREATILVDALPRGRRPGTLYLLDPDRAELSNAAPERVEGHTLDPLQVLRLVETMGGQASRLWIVGCEPMPPDSADDGSAGLSEAVQAAVPEAVAFVEELIANLLTSGQGEPAAYRAAGG